MYFASLLISITYIDKFRRFVEKGGDIYLYIKLYYNYKQRGITPTKSRCAKGDFHDN